MTGDETPTVLSLGSINLDRVYDVTAADLRAYERQYDWFPAAEETVTVANDALPEGFAGDSDELHHGGKGANQAVAAARAGADTTLLGAVGPDADEAGVHASLSTAGVDATALATASVPTGTAHVFRGPGGENRIVVVPGANDAVDPAYVAAHAERALDADCLLLQNEIPQAAVRSLLDRVADRPDPPTVLFDPAPAAGAAGLLGHPAVDYCTPNEHEYEQLQDALASSPCAVVRKDGPDPVVVRDDDGTAFEVSPPTVAVEDTTGAGDVFAGYFGTALAAGRDRQTAVEDATTAASMATRTAGAREGIPEPAAVAAFRTGEETPEQRP